MRASGLGAGRRVRSSRVTKTVSIGAPMASASAHPVRASATGLRTVTRPSASVAITASPMLRSVTKRRASLRSPMTRAACSRLSACSRSLAARDRSRSASSRSFSRRSRMLPASRRPSARSLNSVTRELQAGVGSPRATARAAATAADLGADDAPADDEGEQEAAAEDGDAGGHEEPQRPPDRPVDRSRGQAEADGPARERGTCSRPRRTGCPRGASIASTPRARCGSRSRKSSLGLPPTYTSSARVRAMIVRSASIRAMTPSGGGGCRRRTALNSLVRMRAPST